MSGDLKGWGKEVFGPKPSKRIDITASGPKEQKAPPPIVGPACGDTNKIKWGSRMDSGGDSEGKARKSLNLQSHRSDKIQQGPKIAKG